MLMYLPLLYYYIPTHTEPAARNAAAERRPLNSSHVVSRRERVIGACTPSNTRNCISCIGGFSVQLSLYIRCRLHVYIILYTMCVILYYIIIVI